MDISSNAATGAALTAADGTGAGAVQTVMLRTALDMQAGSTAQLIRDLPPPAAALATSGSLGTNINTYA